MFSDVGLGIEPLGAEGALELVGGHLVRFNHVTSQLRHGELLPINQQLDYTTSNKSYDYSINQSIINPVKQTKK